MIWQLRLLDMKKWSGGGLILALAVILVIRYTLIDNRPDEILRAPSPKNAAYDFFNPSDGTFSSEVYDSERVVRKKTKKPHLVDVEGLSDLYRVEKLSEEESRALLVWAHMRDLLSRSDMLPEGAQGVKEASVAWRDLLSTTEKEKASKFAANGNGSAEAEKDCPFIVSNINNATSVNGSFSLGVPCGLIEGSSITVVGIPFEHDGSFQIELLSGQISRNPKRVVVLHYNVSLPGEIFSEEPVIIQNTWNDKHGWGKEERCPAHISGNGPEVDGLALCNAQVVRSTMEENLNVSYATNYTSNNVSRGSVHATANFPFSDGSLFTATLWIGSKGFHMTVNGRHETSFRYREKMEPWTVSQVRVSGSLDILSVLAKELPVSEDPNMILDVDRLRAPPISRKRLVMLIGVFSTGNNFQRRMALRRSWMQYPAVRSGNVAVRFFIGLHNNNQVNIELWREAQAYGDIQFMPFVDYYSLISLKTIAICILGTKILPAKYMMKTDDDAFVRIDEILSSLKGKENKGLLYGHISFESAPDRDKNSKWYISDEEWQTAYPPWAHGPGYIISRDIAKFIVQGHKQRDLQLFKLEDVAMGIWVQEFKSRGQEVQYIHDERFNNAGCESNYTLAHYQNPRLVLCLWEKLQIEHEATCCE